MRSRRIPITRVAIALAMLLLTPLTFRSGQGLQENDACSRGVDDTCQREIDSVCTIGGAPSWNYYTKLTP